MISNEDLIKVGIAVLVFLLKLLLIVALPLMLFFWLILYSLRVESIFQQLIFTIGLVYILGGFYIFGVKIMEILFRSSEIKAMQFTSFWEVSSSLKFHLKDDFDPEQIKQLWQFISQNLDLEDVQSSQCENIISQEVIIRNGEIEWYLSMPKQMSGKVYKYVNQNLDSLKVTKTIDPLFKWPQNWSKNIGLGPYKEFFASSYELSGSNLYPLIDPETLTGDLPFSSFGKDIIGLDKDMTVVVQSIFVPVSLENYIDSWNNQILDLQDSDSQVLVDSDPKDIKSVTLQESENKHVLEISQEKILKPHFQTHLRLAVFYLKGKKSELHLVEKYFNEFLKKLSTGYQHFSKVKESATNYTYKGNDFAISANFITPFLHKFYQPKSQIRIQKIQYWALRHRGLDVPIDTSDSILDIDSVATLVHMVPSKKVKKTVAASNLLQSTKSADTDGIKAKLMDKLQRLKQRKK